MRRIIALAGYATAGKSTIAALFQSRNPGFRRHSFAKPLKEMADPVLDDMGLPLVSDGSHAKEQRRPFYVFLGRVMRNAQPNYWVRKLANALPSAYDILIDDLRYANEAEWVVQNRGLVVYVSRPGVKAANAEEWTSIGRMCDIFHPQELLNDDTPESAAGRLEMLAELHFRDRAALDDAVI